MSLNVYWGWDVALIVGGLSVTVTDSSGVAGADRTFTVTITTGTYAHVSMASVLGTGVFAAFAAALEAALEAGSAGGATPRTYSVSFSASTGYTIAVDAGTKLTLDFTSTDPQLRMREILGMTGDRTLALTYSSTVRPYYWLIPTIQGRSNMTDEYEPDDVSKESEGDDGSVSQISKDTASVYCDWMQVAEPTTEPGSFTFDDPWTPPYERQAVSAVPWTYQHAFRHARTGGTEQSGTMPFIVADGSESSVHALRADGTGFHPVRFAGTDIQLWSVPFKTRLLGRL